MKVSIVTAYYNRKELLINTLKTIVNTVHDDYEFIVVDDCSNEEHRLEDLVSDFPFLKVIRLEKENKWYINPCIPFNIGFKHATGDIVIIQNPECLHVGDIIKYSVDNIGKKYLSFSCYSADEKTTKEFNKITLDVQNIEKTNKIIDKSVVRDGESGWYNHPTYRAVGLHFCSAILKSDLDRLNGFDERYALGIGYDDNEFLRRVTNIIPLEYVTKPYVIHQHHYNTSNNYTIENALEKVERNKNLFNNQS